MDTLMRFCAGVGVFALAVAVFAFSRGHFMSGLGPLLAAVAMGVVLAGRFRNR